MVWVCVIIMFIGNGFLLTGAMTDELADNPIAWLLVIAAIGLDIFCVYSIASDVKSKKEIQRIADEEQRLSEVANKVQKIQNTYSISHNCSLQKARVLPADKALQSKTIHTQIVEYKRSREVLVSQYVDKRAALTRILACNGCNNVDEKYDYLSTNEERLRQLKSEIERIQKQINGSKIELLNENVDVMATIRICFKSLLSSKKCVSDEVNISDFIAKKQPTELSMFKYHFAPITIFFQDFFYCFFTNVILVFDKDGIYSAALDPTALKITVEKNTENVYVSNNTLGYHKYIDTDSKLIQQGETATSWLHTCRDGSPDLRYSYNPLTSYRYDTYEYSVIRICLNGQNINFTASASSVADSFTDAKQKYIRKYNNYHNPTPDLLSLLQRVSPDDSLLPPLLENYKKQNASENFFCRIILTEKP